MQDNNPHCLSGPSPFMYHCQLWTKGAKQNSIVSASEMKVRRPSEKQAYMQMMQTTARR